jgi:hypothetical protein
MNVVHTLLGAAVFGLLMGGAVLAQESPQPGQANGTTSGPAAGNNVQPGGAMQKKSGSAHARHTSAGAPGTPAKKGTESGPPPKV